MFGWFKRLERRAERRSVGLRLEAMEVRDVPARLVGGVDDHPKLDKPEHGPEVQVQVMDDKGGARSGHGADDPAGHNANDDKGGRGRQNDDPSGHK